MSDILAIKRALADRAGDVAQMLLPGGRKDGSEWRAGSVNGEKGQSLGVHLIGAKAGVWKDFSSDEGGDLLDLWMQVRRLSLTEALDQARSYLGLERHQPYREPRKQYTRPPKPRCTPPRNRVRDYLVEVRNLPPDVIDLYRVGEDGTKIVFPFVLPNGELAMAKVREAVDGASPMPTAANCEPILFGWQAMPADAREVTITEGEIDALSMAAYGFPAMSVPFGGGGKGKQNWIENDFDRLEQFEKIYIATDDDKVGDEAAAEIVARLGRHRCYRVKLPHKDANECMMSGVTKDVIAQCMAAAQPMDPEGLRRPVDFTDRVVSLFWPPHESRSGGYTMPYGGLKGRVEFRPGEVTLWSGASGSGKSQLISDSIPYWIEQGSRVCLASFEMQPQWTLKRMVKQAVGSDRPTVPWIDATLAFLDPGLLLYEKVGKSDIKALLEIFDYARAKYGCDQFVIDSLMRLGIPADDYSGQEQAMFQLVDWATGKNVHLHLVAHARKAERGQGVPEGEDVKGASEIVANAFNILMIWRNRKVEDASEPDDRPDVTDEPGVTVNVAKQRNGDFEGKVKLYFNTRTYQYFSAIDNRRVPRCYVENVDAAALVGS